MTIGERIKFIRESEGKNQRDFAASIKISQPTLAMFENGQREPKDIHIEQICMKYNVNEDWLRTGNGGPTIKRTRNQEIGVLVSELMNLPDSSMKKRFIEAMLKLDEKELEVLVKIAESLKEGG